jgi:hypothetical protein
MQNDLVQGFRVAVMTLQVHHRQRPGAGQVAAFNAGLQREVARYRAKGGIDAETIAAIEALAKAASDRAIAAGVVELAA